MSTTLETVIPSKFILCDGDRVINTNHIRWIHRISETMEICCKYTGCTIGKDTIKVSKLLNPQSYSRLNVMFNEPLTQEPSTKSHLPNEPSD